jgi:hypothetical protein
MIRTNMIAAVYARKSTDQVGVADEQKSIARQIDHAIAYAACKGWTVSEGCVFVDEAFLAPSSRLGLGLSL